METKPAALAVFGHAFQALSPDRIESLPDALILVDGLGTISRVVSPAEPDHAALRDQCARTGVLVALSPGQYLLPGFVDLHVHAPQWPQAGKALHLPLYDWLQDNTFPLEARYADPVFAEKVYDSLVAALLANGTTTAVYFATVHRESSLVLARVCLARGQRGLVGRVAMDLEAPPGYRDESAGRGVEDTRAFIEEVRALPGNGAALALPVVTPRFIPSCGDELLAGLGRLAAEYGCHVQSHCSESDWAHAHVIERLGRRDARALDDFGLLTRKSVLAHCNFLNDDDLDLFRARGAAVAHCPLSNFYFAGAVFPLHHALNNGVHIGLGSDISGGPAPGLFSACRHAITASLALTHGVDPALPPETRGRGQGRIDFRHAFWLATAGGGEALDLPIGRFAPGCSFDAIVLDAHAPHSNVMVWPDLDGDEDILQKIIHNAARGNIARVWVAGKPAGQGVF